MRRHIMGAYDTRLLKLTLLIAFIFIFTELILSYKSILLSAAPSHHYIETKKTIEKKDAVKNHRGVILRPSLSPLCDGLFDFVFPGKFSFEVIEATYDNTPLTAERFGRYHPSTPFFRRIIIQFSVNDDVDPVVGTTERGVNITNTHNITAAIYPPQNEVHIELDHLRKVRCAKPIHEEYSNQRSCVWSMSLGLWPHALSSEQEFTKTLGRLQTSNFTAIHLAIPLLKKETKQGLGTIRPRIGFACVDAFNLHQEVEWLSKSRTSTCTNSRMSLMILGSPISGPASMEAGAIEAAHFAFRALTGKVQFTSVSLGFTTSMTRSRMSFECRGVDSCVQGHIANNSLVMQKYKQLMEVEFDNLGLSQLLRRRIIITEFCRLGGKGPLDGCRRLRASGQVAWGEFTIAQLSYDHKWIGSMDLDEFIGTDPVIPGQHFRPSKDAVQFLDELNEQSGNTDYVQLLWFRTVFDSGANRVLSLGLADSNRLNVTQKDRNGITVNSNDTAKYEPCYSNDNGKSFAKCTHAVGTGVHTSTIVADAYNITTYAQAKMMKTHKSSVRIWEARKQRKFRMLGYCNLTAT